MGWIGDLIGGGAANIIDSVTDGVDKFVTTDEEKQQLELMKGELELKLKQMAVDAENKYFDDRKSARDMGRSDPWTPRILTIVFTIGYFALIGVMLSLAFKIIDKEVNDFAIMLISSIFGAVSSAMVMILAYFFGASQGGDDTGAAIASSFNKATKE